METESEVTQFDGDVQLQTLNNEPIGVNIDGLATENGNNE
jgi:hypothetical protein